MASRRATSYTSDIVSSRAPANTPGRRARESQVVRLLAVNVGLPRDVAWQGQTVRTAIWKSPVAGRRMARRLNVDGDGQGDLAGHGGEQRAVLVYQLASYRFWEKELGRNGFTSSVVVASTACGFSWA